MTAQEAIDLTSWIQRDKIRPADLFKFDKIICRANDSVPPDLEESKFLQEIYRYTADGGGKQDQPFKAYRRRTSWGVK